MGDSQSVGTTAFSIRPEWAEQDRIYASMTASGCYSQYGLIISNSYDFACDHFAR